MRAPTRERLLASTHLIVVEGGYAAASVQAITERTGVASGTLYRHFESKEELFVELFRELCSRELDAMRAAASSGGGSLAGLEAAIETFARRALAEPRLAWALLAEPVAPAVDAERLDYRRRYRELVAGLLAEAIDTSEIPAAEPELIAAAIIGGVGEVLVGPLSRGREGKAAADEALIDQTLAFVRRAAGSTG